MKVVLGIDAAWTQRQPSGVALAIEKGTGWELVASAPSYEHFRALAAGDPPPRLGPSGCEPDASGLLAAASKLSGRQIDLVAIDIPLSMRRIEGRRNSDAKVSEAYGARWCATHTPSTERPGPISVALKEGFERAGYRLLTDSIRPPGLIEVYPHPALVELSGAQHRLPYKISKVRSYWREENLTAPERRQRLFEEWARIVALLETRLYGVRAALPLPSPETSARGLKAFEDALDAVICAVVGIYALKGRVKPFGDQDSAIWIPNANN